MQIAKFFEKVTTDGHLPLGMFVFVVGAVVHWFHGLDASFVAFTTTVLGFLAHHEYMQPDNPQVPPPNTPPTHQ